MESPEGPLNEETVEQAGGIAVRLGRGGEHESVSIYLDFLGDQPVLDLRALGYLQWCVFVGTAVISDEVSGTPEILETDTFEQLLRHQPDRPLEPTPEVYAAISGDPPEQISRRLAALQRFVKAYPRSEQGLQRLQYAAARSFSAWAAGRDDVEPLGRKPLADREEVSLPTGDRLRLAIDSVSRGTVG